MSTRQRPHRPGLATVLCLSFAVSGCWRDSVVGESDGRPRDRRTPTANVVKHVSTIVGADSDENLGTSPILGDVDGDGLDDFLIDTVRPTVPIDALELPFERSFFLFYGKPEFPEQLTTANADASFTVGPTAGGPLPLGDVNGDGLADFAFEQSGQSVRFEIVLGNRTRYSGVQPAGSARVRWETPPLPPPFSASISPLESVYGIGDVNCDGIDDLAVGFNRKAGPEEFGEAIGFGLIHTAYIVLGSHELPNGVFDPSWAAAAFGLVTQDDVLKPEGLPLNPSRAPLQPIAAGDLDGDGCADIVAPLGNGAYVFYGGEHRFEGKVEHHDADALLQFRGAENVEGTIGDADGDGADDLRMIGERLGIMYGSATRWSGIVAAVPDLTFSFPEATQFITSAASGDIDGDTYPEIVFGATQLFSFEDFVEGEEPVSGAMYAVRGSGQRQTGSRPIGEHEIIRQGPLTTAQLELSFIDSRQPLGSTLSMAGDIDGDGGYDIIAPAANEGPTGTVYLIPSTPRAPD